MSELEFTYSQVSSDSLVQLVSKYYDFDAGLTCKFYVSGLHDNYLLDNGGKKYILRIYRNNWRSEEDVLFELDYLSFLSSKTRHIAKLIRTNNGELSIKINTPEGIRQVAMFRYADGIAPENSINRNEVKLLGKIVADIHTISDAYQPQYARQKLDIEYLLNDSISVIKPFIDKEHFAYLSALSGQLSVSMPDIDDLQGVYGLCVGDINSKNFHITNDNNITVFDFDQCGYGFRAFEVGKFFSSIRHYGNKETLKNAFLSGYNNVRMLSQSELAAIPLYEVISVIWVMAIHAENVDRIGFKYLEKPFWDKRIQDVKKMVLHCNKEGLL